MLGSGAGLQSPLLAASSGLRNRSEEPALPLEYIRWTISINYLL